MGFDAASSAAAVRGAISAARDHPFFVDQVGDPMPAALDGALDPRVMGADRLLALARPAIIEACAPLADACGWRSELPPICCSARISTRLQGTRRERFAQGLAGANLPFRFSSVTVAPMGHAAGLAAIAKATREIEAGCYDACLVGGVESYLSRHNGMARRESATDRLCIAFGIRSRRRRRLRIADERRRMRSKRLVGTGASALRNYGQGAQPDQDCRPLSRQGPY